MYNKPCLITVFDWSIDYLEEKLKYSKNHFSTFKISIDLSDYSNFEVFAKILDCIKKANIKLSDCEFDVELKKGLLPLNSYKNIREFYSYLTANKIAFSFKEYNMTWTIKQVEDTYKQIAKTVKKLKSNKLSPFEQILCAYREITNRIYTTENKKENSLLSRSIYGICNSDKIVCTGYAEWVYEVFKMLNNNNIKVYACSVDLIDEYKGTTTGHRTNIVYLKDEKYNIEGFYSLDSCWDSKKDAESVMTLKNCLIPIDDLKFYQPRVIVSSNTNPFIYLLNEHKPSTMLDAINSNVRNVLNEQNFVNMQDEREIYKQIVLNKYENYAVDYNDESYKNLLDNLNNPNFFKGSVLEYTFLKSVCNKIKQKTSIINDLDYEKALSVVCKNVDNMTQEQTDDYVKKVIDKTKNEAFKAFSYGAKNSFAIISKAELTRSQQRAKEILERREKAKQKRQNDLKQKTNSKTNNELTK